MSARLLKMKAAGEKIAMLACYDAALAAAAAAAGVDALLVGDSLGMVAQGGRDTLAVRARDIAYHTRCVRAGAPQTPLIADMPFGSYHESPQQAFRNAARFLAAGADMVKMEGGADFAETAKFLTARGIPLCAHIGLMPQHIRQSGAYRVQGRGEDAARIEEDARALDAAGAALMVLEMLPANLAAGITQNTAAATIGIGAGAQCDGQVLVAHDVLGMGAAKKIARNFLANSNGVEDALRQFVRAVKSGEFPGAENSF